MDSDVKLLELKDKDLSLLGVEWLVEGRKVLQAAKVEDTTPEPPQISIGMGFGGGRGGRSRHSDQNWGNDNRRSGGIGGGMGVSVPLSDKGTKQVTSARLTFVLAEEMGDVMRWGWMVFMIQRSRTLDRKIVVQPLVVPIIFTRDPKAAQKAQEGRDPKYVVVREGQTINVAGLDETDPKRKVPLLEKIPFISSLFKSKDPRVVHKEVVIFLTPHMVVSPGE